MNYDEHVFAFYSLSWAARVFAKVDPEYGKEVIKWRSVNAHAAAVAARASDAVKCVEPDRFARNASDIAGEVR